MFWMNVVRLDADIRWLFKMNPTFPHGRAGIQTRPSALLSTFMELKDACLTTEEIGMIQGRASNRRAAPTPRRADGENADPSYTS